MRQPKVQIAKMDEFAFKCFNTGAFVYIQVGYRMLIWRR